MGTRKITVLLVSQLFFSSALADTNDHAYEVEVSPYGMSYDLPPYGYDKNMETRHAPFGYADVSVLVNVDGGRLAKIRVPEFENTVEVSYIYFDRVEMIGTSQYDISHLPNIAADHSAGYLTIPIKKETGRDLEGIRVTGTLSLAVFSTIKKVELKISL